MSIIGVVRGREMVRISVGWALAAGSERLMHDADDALAAAKRGGKDQALSAANARPAGSPSLTSCGPGGQNSRRRN